MKLNEKFKIYIDISVTVIPFAAFLWTGVVTFVEYNLMTNTTERTAIVVDNDLRSEKMYIVAIKDHANKDLLLSMEGNSKKSLIEVGDSALVLYNPDIPAECHLHYFFETDTLSNKRQAINELRERIPTPPKYRMRIWPPIIFISLALFYVYIIIVYLRKKYNINRP